MVNDSDPLTLVSRWCALSTLGSRRLRAAARDPQQLNALWHRSGKPRLSEKNALSLKRWLAETGQVWFCWQDQFPKALLQIPDPPVALFVRGGAAALARPRIAIVGSRAATHSGVGMARRLTIELGLNGVLVVSGLAQGIDCAAHEGALAEGLPTVAIPGSGLGNLYPRSHRSLATEILNTGGLLISEYAPWVAPHKSSFPARNRLISGLAAGVIVVQAALRSGSLITARLASEQGREVMAVPGAPGSPVSAGCNALLREGAALIETADDVYAALDWELPAKGRSLDVDSKDGEVVADPSCSSVLSALDAIPVSVEELIQFTGCSALEVQRALLMLELGGLVEATAQGYIRASLA